MEGKREIEGMEKKERYRDWKGKEKDDIEKGRKRKAEKKKENEREE